MKNNKTTRKSALKTSNKKHAKPHVKASPKHAKAHAHARKAAHAVAKAHAKPKIIKPVKLTKKELQEIHDRETAAAALTKTRGLVSEAVFCEYITKAVGSHANVIIGKLLEGPKVDEKLSETLNIKLNETRRVLNVLNSYGIVRYNINKDSNGWLTFLWYIDHNSVSTFRDQITRTAAAKSVLPEGCNDFFACPACSKKQKMVLPFEVAFDSSFKCTCGKGLQSVSKEEAESIYSAVMA